VTAKIGVMKNARWYGCPACGRVAALGGHNIITGIEFVTATIDRSTSEPHVASDGALNGNWLARRSLFDFDSVEILDADEIDVQKFCVQVRNDTDLERKRRYRTMQCRVSNRLELRENTIRNLSAAFGKVVRV
jgi:hypothetical protein